ncbi:NAD-dependent epimerase/dehydratase [Streptomyces sp. NBC_01549]|uniref:NAD-dependent epimerase/dehydratase family protein n=1 Tax=Streptomyces sp. NBC_01549 TaxID=2975874 RepID=UPI00224DE44C|nr:NAD-dependent epimerase/dehydratase [Streptomyces sp. NBC_01549]MCX4591825.1 NAD-dependent epimerase/dehydratase [Streptomyces sp. NBC_01549]
MAVKTPLVVVLGAAGFVGSAVVRELARHPVRVRAVSRRRTAVPKGARAEIEVCTADLTEPGMMAAAVADADVVIHSIAYIAGSSTWRIADGDTAAERVNVGLMRDLLEALRDRKAGGAPPIVLFTGSASAAGPSDKEVLDGTETDRPKGEYDRQKLAAERVLLAADAAGTVRGACLRLPTVFGYSPGSTTRDKGIVSTMVRRAVAGEPLTMWHDGTVRRDLLHVDDVARAFSAAIDCMDALAGQHWLLGTGHGAPLGAVFTTISELVAEQTGKDRVPVVSVDPPAHAEVRDFRSVTIDSSAFRAATGWQPRTSLEEGLSLTTSFCTSGQERALPE